MVSSHDFEKNERGNIWLVVMFFWKNERGNYVLILLSKNGAINNIETDFLDCYVFLWIMFELLYCYDMN